MAKEFVSITNRAGPSFFPSEDGDQINPIKKSLWNLSCLARNEWWSNFQINWDSKQTCMERKACFDQRLTVVMELYVSRYNYIPTLYSIYFTTVRHVFTVNLQYRVWSVRKLYNVATQREPIFICKSIGALGIQLFSTKNGKWDNFLSLLCLFFSASTVVQYI